MTCAICSKTVTAASLCKTSVDRVVHLKFLATCCAIIARVMQNSSIKIHYFGTYSKNKRVKIFLSPKRENMLETSRKDLTY
jgi:hypothetical protein